MFNKEGAEEISKDIFVFHNFIEKDICDIIFNKAQQLQDKDWELFGPHERYMSIRRVSEELHTVKNKIDLLLQDEAYLGNAMGVQKMIKGSYMPPHSDNFEFKDVIKGMNEYVEGTDFDLVPNNCYGLVVYFNDFEGGEIEYIKKDIKYKPSPGDLVIHCSSEDCAHRVNEVKSDVRYAYANNIFKYVKIPKGYMNVI
jgi:hypothetical protein